MKEAISYAHTLSGNVALTFVIRMENMQMQEIKDINRLQRRSLVNVDLCEEHGGETETCCVEGSLDGAGCAGECWVWSDDSSTGWVNTSSWGWDNW